MWEVALNRVLPNDNLQKRGVTHVNRCTLCKQELEMIEHLILWCKWAKRLWETSYALLRINGVVGGSIQKELWAWSLFWQKKGKHHMIYLILFAIFWVL